MSHAYEVVRTTEVFRGRIWSVRSDEVAMPGDATAQRDVVAHPGAVAVVALRGDGDGTELLLVNQYRHPVARRLDELPAGLLDVAHEPALAAAQRELAEEAGCAADRWQVLVDVLTSPGFSDEAIRVFLATGVHEVVRDVQEHEELELTARWVPLSWALDAALAGELENGICVTGVLAAAQALARGGALRPGDAPWPSRPAAAPTP